MIKLLIVDDEPLAQIGIESMLDWKSYGISICGKAMNGIEALKLIEHYSPDLVITDIKMPRMDGMELVKQCHETYGKLPLFIILTCFEEFKLVKEAIAYQVVDYLVKLELNCDILGASIKKALAILNEIKPQKTNAEASGKPLLQSFYDKFFIRLLHNLFESKEQFLLQAKDLNLSFTAKSYVVTHCEINIASSSNTSKDQQITLYNSTLQIIREIVGKQILCHIVPLDMKRFSIIFCIEENKENDISAGDILEYNILEGSILEDNTLENNTLENNTLENNTLEDNILENNTLEDSTLEDKIGVLNNNTSKLSLVRIIEIIKNTSTMVDRYFNVRISASVGRECIHPLQISETYQEARQIFSYTTKEQPILCVKDFSAIPKDKTVFNLAIFKNNITKAFDELDTDILFKTFTEIIDLFQMYPQYFLQAMDAACNTLYLALSLLPDGDTTVSEIFLEEVDGYRSIYQKRTMNQVISWMITLRDGLCDKLNTKRKTLRHHVVTNVQKYIHNHVNEKLALNDVAAVFGISPNYLSMLFKKYNDIGFTEYINQCKINKSKELMENTNLKIYEIADQLGFESAFYFSKVFKKQEGCSPKEYWQKIE